MAPATLNAANPHRNTVRNLRKAVTSIADLKTKDLESLDKDQQKKVKTAKKTDQELAAAEKNYDIWEVEQAASPAATPAPASAPAPAAGKKEKAKEAPAAEKPAEKKKAKEDKKAPAPAAKTAKSPARAPVAEPEPEVASLIDPKEEKTIRNRVKNLKTKLDQIAELKKKDAGELGDDQKTKMKGEKKIREEHTQLVGKLQAFGLTP